MLLKLLNGIVRIGRLYRARSLVYLGVN